MPVLLHAQIGVGEGGGAAQNVLQTVLKADLPQNFYVYMYLNIKFVGQFFHFHMTKKCGKVVQNFALFRLSDFCNWTLVKRGSVKKYNQRWRQQGAIVCLPYTALTAQLTLFSLFTLFILFKLLTLLTLFKRPWSKKASSPRHI